MPLSVVDFYRQRITWKDLVLWSENTFFSTQRLRYDREGTSTVNVVLLSSGVAS